MEMGRWNKDRFRGIRERYGMTQAEFARALSEQLFHPKQKFSRQQISAWENGTRVPGWKNLMRLSIILNVGQDYLMGEDTLLKGAKTDGSPQS